MRAKCTHARVCPRTEVWLISLVMDLISPSNPVLPKDEGEEAGIPAAGQVTSAGAVCKTVRRKRARGGDEPVDSTS